MWTQQRDFCLTAHFVPGGLFVFEQTVLAGETLFATFSGLWSCGRFGTLGSCSGHSSDEPAGSCLSPSHHLGMKVSVVEWYD